MLLKSKVKGAQTAIALLLIVTALISAGCVPPPPAFIFEYPVMTSDGSGGIIVRYVIYGAPRAWERYPPPVQRRIYLQRIDREGNLLWGEGVLMREDYSAHLAGTQIEGNEYGGAIIANFFANAYTWAWTVTKVSPAGEILWQREFLDKWRPSLIGDGLGGAIIRWIDAQRRLKVQRIDPKGEFLWGEGGITLSEEPLPSLTYIDAAITEREAAIFVWQEEDGTIFAQKISLKGELLWPEGGVQVASLEQLALPQGIQVVCDGSGGAIIAWIRILYEITPGGAEIEVQRINAQRIHAHGHILWQDGGIPVFSEEAKGFLLCPFPSLGMVGSGAGEAIIISRERRGSYAHTYAQKIDRYGDFQWQEGGVLISRLRTLCPPRLPSMSLVSDNAGGAIHVFGYRCEEARRTLFQAQRVDAKGRVLWQKPGASVTTTSPVEYSSLPDGRGGVFVSWGTGGSGSFWWYVQRITPEGNPAWGRKGIRLNP